MKALSVLKSALVLSLLTFTTQASEVTTTSVVTKKTNKTESTLIQKNKANQMIAGNRVCDYFPMCRDEIMATNSEIPPLSTQKVNSVSKPSV